MATDQVTYVVRTDHGFDTRTSPTMVYTHARVRTSDGAALSWHTTEANAAEAAKGQTGVKVLPVEAHPGTKGKVLKALKADAADVADTKKDGNYMEPVIAATQARREAAAKKAPAKDTAKKATAAPAARRTVPTEAANKARQAYVAEVGIDRYRNQYNGGWDAATAGTGSKKAASGSAPVAWMDGYTDRIANPGKAGIASKWSALRSTDAPVKKVAAPKE